LTYPKKTNRDECKMPISRVLVTRFFQLVTDRRFAEAERTLERVKLKVHATEWNRGYLEALQGILLATKSNDDQYVFLSNVNPDNKDELKQYRREFLESAKNKLHADYDRGFFSAWADHVRVLIKLQNAEKQNDQKETKQVAESEQQKTEEERSQSAELPSRTETDPKKIVQTTLD
jgi:hypothetical protein